MIMIVLLKSPSDSKSLIFTVHNSTCGKVMFLQASVCPQGGHVWRGACMGVCMTGSMCGRGVCMVGDACVAGGHA